MTGEEIIDLIKERDELRTIALHLRLAVRGLLDRRCRKESKYRHHIRIYAKAKLAEADTTPLLNPSDGS